MKINGKSGQLASLLERVSKAVSPRSTIQLLQGILFEAKDGALTMSATDMEISISLSAEAGVEQEGRVVIPAKTLLQYVRSLPDGDLQLADDGQSGAVTLSCAKSAVSLRRYAADDFPKLPGFPEKGGFTVDAKAFAAAVSKVLPFASKDEKRPVLTGVLVDFSEGSVKLVATDSYRLGVNEAELKGATEEAGTAIVPARALREAARLAGLGVDELEVAITENNAAFRVGGGALVLSTRLIEGTFPDYARLLPDSFSESFLIDRAELIAAVGRAKVLAEGVHPPVPVKLDFSRPEETLGDGEVNVSLESQEKGATTEVVAAEVPEGKQFKVCFNPNYLADAVGSLECEKLAIRLNDPLKPAVLEPAPERNGSGKNGSADGDARAWAPSGHLCLVMPMRDPKAG